MTHEAPARYLGHHLPAPVLVYWRTGGTNVQVHRTTRRHHHYRAEAGRFDLWPQGEYTTILADSAQCHKLVLELVPEATERLLQVVRGDTNSAKCRFQFVDSILKRLLQRMVAYAAEGEPLGRLFTESLSVALLQRLESAVEGQRPAGAEKLPMAVQRRLLELIHSHLGSPPSIADMALVAGVRSAVFLRSFRASFGASPHQFVLARRIDRAKLLLIQDRPLTEIAFELGFATHAHFTLTFHARTGATPSEYRTGPK